MDDDVVNCCHCEVLWPIEDGRCRPGIQILDEKERSIAVMLHATKSGKGTGMFADERHGANGT